MLHVTYGGFDHCSFETSLLNCFRLPVDAIRFMPRLLQEIAGPNKALLSETNG